MINQKERALFPRNEEWATGDEALDLKLTLNLNLCFEQLSYQSISDFYFMAKEIKTRAYNPLYNSNIVLVTKALLAYLLPENCNNDEFRKIIGKYFEKKLKKIEISKQDLLIDGLKMLKKFRYENQIDFYLEEPQVLVRNPYVIFPVKNSNYEVQAKIIFKEVTRYLRKETDQGPDISFLNELRAENTIICLKGLGEFWFYDDQVFSISNL